MLRRKIDVFLKQWKNDTNHLPLIVYGARQVGKTTSILKFGQENYKKVIVINFIENPEYKTAFIDFSVNNIIKRLTYMNPNFSFIPNETLIFFDEIQSFMDVMTSLKFFAIDKKYDVICSGSALGINNNHISSISVGYQQEYIMYPLDFEEFLWAVGYGDDFIDILREKLCNLELLDKLILSIINEKFDEYIILGGMPKIVSEYIKCKNFSKPYYLQKQLRKDYSNDIKQYVDDLDKSKVEKVYNNIALQLGKENHKFQFTKLGHGARFNSYFGCFEWLKSAGIVLVCNNVIDIRYPLPLYEEEDNFRAYYLDSGLFISFFDTDTNKQLRVENEFSAYKGALYENVVLSELYKSGFENIFFYRSKDSTIELDFLLQYNSEIIPIEVKAKKGKTLSLNTAINKFEEIKYSIKLSRQNIGYTNKIITLPYALTFLLKDFLNSNNYKKLINQ